MEHITKLNDLLSDQLEMLLRSELQLLYGLPRIIPNLNSLELKSIAERDIEIKKRSVNELGVVMAEIDIAPVGLRDNVMHELMNNANKLIEKSIDLEILDAGMILILQQINHYLIATYGTLSSYLILLNHEEAGNRLHKLLIEYKKIDYNLTEIAEKEINKKAKFPNIQDI